MVMIVSAQLQKVLPLNVYDPQMLTQEDQWYRVHSFDWRQNTQKRRVSLLESIMVMSERGSLFQNEVWQLMVIWYFKEA